uniref:non-specific serine/threonine protein kinase n=1 Tax=Oryza punctata TaxID=4537 RepID=A0A0E0KQI4_ORYPU
MEIKTSRDCTMYYMPTQNICEMSSGPSTNSSHNQNQSSHRTVCKLSFNTVPPPLLHPLFIICFLMPLHHVLLCPLLLLSLHTTASSAATDTVSPGHALVSSNRLVSNNSKFALGFFKPGNESSSYTNHNSYLGIWFNKVPKLTPLWTANGENPVMDPTSPELAISGDGNLAILDEATKFIIWSTHAKFTANDTTIAVLLNNGNLVLRSSLNSSIIFWQSFDHPTDTLFSGAKIGWDKATGLNRRLVSRKNSIDQAPGIYSLELGLNGDGHLLWNSTVAYWSSGDWKGRYFGQLPEMTGSFMPNFTFFHNDQEAYFIYTLSDETTMMHTGIDVFGRGFVGIWLEGLQDWFIYYRQPVVNCDVYAICGPFTICNDNKDPFCECMKGYSIRSPKDWELDDRKGGCMRNTPLSCGASKDRTGLTDKFYSVQSIRLPQNAEILQAPTSGEECSQVCLSNCSCTAYSYGNGGCSIWHDELYNVKQLSDASPNGHEGVLYIRLAAKELQSSQRKTSGKIIGVAIGTSIGALFLMILLPIVWKSKGKWFARTLEKPKGGIGITAFRYTDTQRATKNFSEKLGGGSFGSVFKGYISDSTIAVKRLDGARQGEKQFRAEVNSIGIIQHINLVKLIGFCCEGDNRLLVYEYMPNCSLDVCLFEANDIVLDWTTRYQIAIGVARGLAYLHDSCRDCIIHCDIKPENILLDASYIPKIADFGMAKILGREFSRAMTTMRGTIGYIAPEWISGTVVTSKVDVYSYGMVLFEIISGRRNRSHEQFMGGDYSFYFPMQVAHKLLEGDIGCLVDANLEGDVNLMEIERACKIACWCIQDHEFDRPTMAEVVQSLEGLLELNMPPLPRLLNAITGGSHSVTPQYFNSLKFLPWQTPISVGQAFAKTDKLVSKNGRFQTGISPLMIHSSGDNNLQVGNIAVLNQSRKTIIWSTQANTTANNSIATHLSSGNLILTNLSNSSESFDYPTDTYFPRAKFGWNKVTGLNRHIISWENSRDPAIGVYCKLLVLISLAFAIESSHRIGLVMLGMTISHVILDVGGQTKMFLKLNVMGYGMVLLENILGRRNSSKEVATRDDYKYFLVLVAHKMLDGDVGSLVDQNLHVDVDLEQAKRAIRFACWYIQDNELDRPTMSEVVQYQSCHMPHTPSAMTTSSYCRQFILKVSTEQKFSYTNIHRTVCKLASIPFLLQFSNTFPPCNLFIVCFLMPLPHPHHVLLGLLLLSMHAPASSAATDTVSPGHSLAGSDRLVSNNSKFALGFFKPDFGMAKILGREFSRAMTTMRGTIGYMAPEWISGTVVTSKVDVYSYGMVLFEIISGRRNSSHECFRDGDYSFFFPMQVARKLLNGDIGSLVDASLKGDINLVEVERACKIACWCIQDNEFDRPTMAEVVQALEGLLELDMPPLPRLLSAITGGSHSVTPQYFDSGVAVFGSVYKGSLEDSNVIAVKTLHGVCQGEKQFRDGVSSIGIIQHINLAKLIGFCSEGSRRLLVYEYMPNHSLDVHLFQSNTTSMLSWTSRYQIALGIARGLACLHESCRDRIIHTDIKP